jgi:bla regulator protein BlaR1
MNTSFWTPYISDGTIKAICWTLIHSLWIGMIIALLAGIIISLTRKSAATLRYHLLCAVLVLFVFSIVATCFIEVRTNTIAPIPPPPPKVFITITGASTLQHAAVAQNQSIVDRTKEFLNQNINIIFLVWLLFFMLKSLKLVSGLLYIQRIRNYKIHAVAEEFKQKMELFSRQIGIRQTVRLVQSELVKVPVAVGWLKPVILLPIGIVFQLSPEQLESILWHELAHIHRRDYLVNILQGLVETVFFFNPGLLWLSSLIRAEREACCDDIVLSRTDRKANYLEALLSFGYENNSSTVLAMSIGSGNQLRDRMKRMINQENKRLNMAEKIVLAAGLILLLAFTTLPKTAQAVRYLSHLMTKKHAAGAVSKLPHPTPPPPSNPQPSLLNKPQQFVNDTIVKKTDTAIRFTSVLFEGSDADMANNNISAMDDKGNEYHFTVANNVITAMEVNNVKVADDKLAGFQYMIGYIDREVALKRRVRAEDIAGFKANAPDAKFKHKDTTGYNKRKYDADRLPRDILPRKQYDKQRYTDGREPEPKYLKSEGMRKRMQEDSTNYAVQEQRPRDVIADLVKEKVVSKASDVKWFGLSNTEFIVNGKKQSDEMQQRYKAKYGIYEGNGLYYGPVQMHGVGIFIDNKDINDPTGRMLNFQRDRAQKLKLQEQQLSEQNVRLQKLPDDQAKSSDERMKLQELKLQQLSVDQLRWQKEQEISLQGDSRQKYGSYPLMPVISNVIADLVSANVISDKSELIKFNLTNTALMVNGKKQPDELHEKLKAKYLEQQKLKFGIANDPNFGLHYDVKNGDMGLGITSGPDSP